jgi:hypothetical protein
VSEKRTQHTPGPWEVVGVGAEGFQVNAEGTSVARIPWHSGADAANARLIAAAPTLLETLAEGVQNLEGFPCLICGEVPGEGNCRACVWIRGARTALAKARGGK